MRLAHLCAALAEEGEAASCGCGELSVSSDQVPRVIIFSPCPFSMAELKLAHNRLHKHPGGPGGALATVWEEGHFRHLQTANSFPPRGVA